MFMDCFQFQWNPYHNSNVDYLSIYFRFCETRKSYSKIHIEFQGTLTSLKFEVFLICSLQAAAQHKNSYSPT